MNKYNKEVKTINPEDIKINENWKNVGQVITFSGKNLLKAVQEAENQTNA